MSENCKADALANSLTPGTAGTTLVPGERFSRNREKIIRTPMVWTTYKEKIKRLSQRIVEVQLSPEEKAQLDKSAAAVKELIDAAAKL